MARKRIVPIREELNKLIRPSRLQKLAVETRTLQRQRKIDIVALFWTVVLGFAIGRNRTMASLRRAYEISTGTVLVPSAFYDKFTARFTKFMKKVTAEILTSLSCGMLVR